MKKRLLILCLLAGSICVGCGNKDAQDMSVVQVQEETEDSTEEAENTTEETTEETEDTTAETEGTEDTENMNDEEFSEENIFAELKNREFYFSSGAGGWRTILHIDDDGSFLGEYSDSDMGSTGDEYPNGTYYVCSFHGKFTKPVKVNEYTYSVGIAEIEYDHEIDTQEIIDGTLYYYSGPYGIEGTNSLLIYLPGAPINELPTEYMDWVRFDISDKESTKLPFYGIYNQNEKNGFSSYEMLNPMEELMLTTEKASDEIKNSLENEVLTQQEMNQKSYELYQTWDNALNKIWTELKNQLSKEEFETILEEQRAWITEKENAVEKAGAEMAGGSMEPLLRNMEAAEYTEKRVYELYELLK